MFYIVRVEWEKLYWHIKEGLMIYQFDYIGKLYWHVKHKQQKLNKDCGAHANMRAKSCKSKD